MGFLGKIFKKVTPFEIYAPVDGDIISLADVKDKMFSKGIIGEGIAILPCTTTICAPCDGKLSILFETGHAFGIEFTKNCCVLVHIGLESVGLNGEGFTILKSLNDRVMKGDPIVEVNLNLLKEKSIDTVIPIIMLPPEDSRNYRWELCHENAIKKGELLMKGEIL